MNKGSSTSRFSSSLRGFTISNQIFLNSWYSTDPLQNASFNILQFLSFIDYLQQNYYDNHKKRYHQLHEHENQSDDNMLTLSPKTSPRNNKTKKKKKECICENYSGRYYWNLYDAIGISTSKIVENIISRGGIDNDVSLGAVGVTQGANVTFTLKNAFIRGNGEIIRYKKEKYNEEENGSNNSQSNYQNNFNESPTMSDEQSPSYY